jgi:hypothetical protein
MPLEKPKNMLNSPATSNSSIVARTDRAFNNVPRLAGTSLGSSSPLLASNRTPKSSPNGSDATPMKTFLGSNITPRSGPRKTRVNTASPNSERTPDGIARNAKAAPTLRPIEKKFEAPRGSVVLGLRCAGSDTTNRAGGIFSNAANPPLLHRGSSQEVNNRAKVGTRGSSPKFFHADEIKKDLPTKSTSQYTELSSRPRSVISADGLDDIGIDEVSNTASPTEQMQPKFFYANGMPEKQATTVRSRSIVESVNSARPSPKQSTFPPYPHGSSQRAASPLKHDGVVDILREGSVSTRRISSASSSAPNHMHGNSAMPLTSPTETGRRYSLRAATVPIVGHNKANSVSSLDPKTTNKLQTTSTPKTPTFLRPLSVNLGRPITPPEKQEGFKENLNGLPSPNPQSPQPIQQSPSRSLPVEGNLEQLNALAANARRERKVLDLEISNSSLLAINRTLEREMRKQTAELRRYRRLTSAGRISIAPSRRSTSSRPSESSDLDGIESDFEDQDFEISSEGENSSRSNDLSTSPGVRDAHTQWQRSEAKKRLQLDISKHQELLLDSQRMNQSIKRCLGWTEDLIKEGQRALAYQVKVDNDVRGRVLTPEEAEGVTSRGRALLSPALEHGGDPWAHFGAGIQADSAIEVE